MTSDLIGLIFGALLILIIINLFATAVIAHKYVETIEKQLPNCSSVQTIREAWSGGGLIGKIMRGGIIATILMAPNLSTRRGLIDIKEVRNLSGFYKKSLLIPTIVTFFLFFCLMALRVSAYFWGF
ncbi:MULTISPECIES: hypothetical protein [Pseudomonas]|uniref:Uncharacterized protein n=4 Tax=Pseudomonas syringae group genomosp. 2 TaxID=251698 RepID=A0A3M2Z4A8_PSEAJ|nr:MULTISPECIES: hypothetical protein [Pseudomonas syringae group]KEZ25157.1 hypothetical protein A3SK_0122660 [Pseudomonas amygdali pv. tabaci str. 6605]KIY15358.1 hypothetical protein RD00_24135 [Pseudomonas amygdali pv. tabaci]KTC57712.1 hypothetical protein AO287_01460 [Pseudomonas savastanoi]MDU8604559.1 hypothetical protein [Pseudomonas syringae group sp. 247E2]MDU8629630.1 hypothetical protein [Pseudomonas syringae group sp. 243L2]